MRKLFALVVFVSGLLAADAARAQTVLPRAGWVANASSSNGGDVPANVLDGSSSSRWTTGGDQTPGQWFTVDFGTAKTFTQVTLDVGGSTTDYARSYELYVSNDGQTWGAPVANGTGATGVITIVFPAQTARFVGIVQTGTGSNWWSIAELNVYNGTVPTVPLTPSGWTATASVSGSSTPASNAIDGTLSTRWSTGTNQVNGQWLKVDMGSPQLLAGLTMDSDSSSSDYARGYQVYVSSDGTNWGSAIASGTATASPITVYFAQVTARYVKIVQTGTASNWWSIAELTMYTPGSVTPTASVLPRNGWTATASSSSGGDVPANTMDDSSSTRWSTGVNQANGQYFKLDMQTTWSFTKITLDAGSSSSDYPRGYQVFVSTDGSSWGSAVATGSGSGALTTITFPLQVARYIKVVQTGTSSTNWWSIAEMNVYGTAPALLLRDNWTATSSLNSSTAQQSVDGKIETEWSTGTAQVNGQWLKIDMKAAQTFNEITLDVTCNPADYARGYQVFASTDGSSWGSAIASGPGLSSMITVAFPTQTARYLKVVQTASATNYWGVAEVNVINTNPSLCSTPCVALDQCHVAGTCNPSTGVCSNPLKTDGSSCSDGNACTQTDTCQAGVCTGSNPVTCTASDQCHTAGTCNTSTGVCSNPTKTDGSSCSDGNACTQTDTCQAGVCTGANPVTCTAQDQCHTVGTCNTATGVCSNPTKANGTSCSDGNACTQTDTCQAGVCTGSNPVTCAASDQCHVAGVCDTTTGVCSNPIATNGTSCNDGNACTQVDTCQAGTCTGGSLVTCAASDQCHTAGVCNPSTGACSNPVAANGTTCSDGNACTQTDTCQSGVCTGGNPVTCAASDQCHTVGTCDTTTGVCSNPAKANGTSCSDGNACTQTDTCQSGVCTGSNPVTCAASDQCHTAGTCNTTTGVCSNPTKADGSSCSDGNACTQTDTCQAGRCTGSNLVTCTAQDQCHTAGTCDTTTGACSNPAKANGSSCSDGNACTQTDSCQSGVCTGGNPVTCAAQDQCHTAGTCDTTTGACSNPAKANGTSCSDGNACTQTDTCQAGTCTGSNPVTCTAQDQCHTAGTCDTTTGACSNPAKANGTSCSDGNACTQTDTCQSGTCTGSNPVTCTSSDQCHTAGTCDTTTGACSNPTKANGTSCSDGNACTQTDTCQAGTCTGSNPVTCAPSDQCHTAGTCDTTTGVCSNPAKTDGTSCNDGNACTQTDSCVAGTCTGGNPVTCTASDQCHAAGTCDPSSGICSNPAKANGAACDDGNTCTQADTCVSGACVGGASSCASLTVTLTTPATAAPRLSVTLASDVTDVVPGDPITFTSNVTNVGTAVDFFRGTITVTNAGSSSFVVGGYQQRLEYFSLSQHAWVPFARQVYDATGQRIPETTLTQLQWSFVETEGGSGVTYSSDPVVGTSITAGSTANWQYRVWPLIPGDVAKLIFDPAQSGGLRGVVQFDTPSGSTPAVATSDFSAALSGVTGEIGNPAVSVIFRDTPVTVSLVPQISGPIEPGDTRTFTLTTTVPPVPPRTASESDADYSRRLFFTPILENQAIATASGQGFQDYPPSQSTFVPINLLLPSLAVTKTGPAQAVAGLPLQYSVGLQNVGTATAEGFQITDSVDGATVASTFTAPASVVSSQTGTATLSTASPLSQPAGPYTDVVAVTWQDRNGNVYGPMHGTYTTNLLAGHPEGYLTLVAETTAPALVGTARSVTATALDGSGHPVANLPVQLTVTGVNAQTVSLTTGADGTATFSYSGPNLGNDTIVASATPTTTAITTAPVKVLWATPNGTPCTGASTPLDVMFVIDDSPSMLDQGKIQAVATASSTFIDDLDPTRDQVGVVLFMGGADIVAPLGSSAAQAKANMNAGIQSAIDSCSGFCAGGTNIPLAFDRALDELSSPRHRSGARPTIVFLSDGGNTGVDPAPEIARAAAMGAKVVSIGVGAYVDTTMMLRLASSQSDYFYAPAASDVAWVYNSMTQDICRNLPPLVRAGGDQGAYGVRLPHVLTLNGEVHDDGPLGDPRLTSEWTTISGPGTVTFADASSPVTTAIFDTPGTYVLQLAATDGFLETADRATITVDSEPSLAGASLVATLGTPGPLVVGAAESLVATLTDSGGHPISNFPVQVTVTGPDAQVATVVTNASGVATLSFTGLTVGTDVLTAVALGTTQVSASPVSVTWTPAGSDQVVTQGWIGSPLHQSSVNGAVGITVGSGVTLTSGTVTYWPLSAPDQVHTLATGVTGSPGAVIATLDTTVLANGPWVVKLDATDSDGQSQVSESEVTVSGDYKPGRVVVEETDMTIPVAGIPLTIGRRYDSLEKDNVGDFGHGWSLTLGHPRLEVDQAHNVTLTMPDNRRVTFYFQATSVTPSITFAWLYGPGYVPEAGTYGSLKSDGCDLLTVSSGQIVCFLSDGLEYAPTTYTYTDQFGRVFVMGASGELKSITDRQQNTLTFTAGGISSSAGPAVTFARDTSGRITSVTSPPVDAATGPIVYGYVYDANGDLTKVNLPTDFATKQYSYSSDHRLLTSKDPNGNTARTSTYDDAGHLLTDADALGNVTSYAYDFGAHKTTITNPDNGTVEQTFDDRGLLLKEVDPLGRTTQHSYDANRNELTRTNALAESMTFTYDTNGNQTSIKNARGETTTIIYNAFSQPVTSTDPTGHTTTIAYDDLGIPTKFSDELGTLATFTSSEHGLPLTVTDAAGKTVYMTYDDSGKLTSRTDRLGRTSTSIYDGAGRVVSTTNPRGFMTRYAYLIRGPKSQMVDVSGEFGHNTYGYHYDENLNLTSEFSDEGRFTNYTYNALNQLTQTQHADSTTTKYTRDFRGNPLTETDEAGRVKTYEYDEAGQLKKTTFPDGTFTTRTYDALGRLKTATDERGNTTSYEYEAGCGCAERQTKATDPLGRATVTTYDGVGRRASVADGAGHTTSYAYDGRGHLTTTTYPDGTTETDSYDSLSRRTTHTDQMGSVTQYGYDAEGQLTSVTDALSNVTQYSYDAAGNLASVTDANHHTTSYSYDHLNRKSQRTLPLGASESWVYNMYGDAKTHTDFRGKTTTMTYDGLARLLTKAPDPSLGEPSVTFTYGPTGTRSTMTDASGATSYTYDSRDRLLTKAAPAGTLTYTYDPAGNLGSIRSSNGTSVDYSWDTANQLVSVADNRVGGVTTAAYTSTGRPSTLAQPSGVGAAYSYDSRDRVTALTWARGANPVGSWSYQFNDRGQRTGVTDATGRHVAYGYDAVSRVVSETVSGETRGGLGNGAVSYSLDPTGNRLSRTSTLAALGAQTFSYDANDELTTDGYDTNGNTTSSEGHTYSYDFENRLVSKDSGAVTIAYDGDGNRVAKTARGVTTKYLVDDLNPTGYVQVLEEVSGGTVQVGYTYGTTLVSQTRMPGLGGQTNYYGYDAHGNIAFLTDSLGALTDSYDYDAFGTVIAQTGSSLNTRLYGGEELDADLGLINLRARLYQANTGRFLTLDQQMGSVLSPVSFNRYLYGNADAVNLHDPLGRGAAEFTLALIALDLMRTSAYIGTSNTGPRVLVRDTSVLVAIGLKVACIFWTMSDVVVNGTYITVGSSAQTPPPPWPWTYCMGKYLH